MLPWLSEFNRRTKANRARLVKKLVQDVPNWPSVAVRSWILARHEGSPFVRQVLDGLIQGGAISRVVYRWQYNTEETFYCKNPTPDVARPVIEVNDMCPLYKRRVRQGYARLPKGYEKRDTWKTQRMAEKKGRF